MKLILHFNRYPAVTADYFRFDQEVLVDQGRWDTERLAELLQEKPCDDIRFIIPGETVTSLTATAPRGSARQIEQALPFVVEEHLATPVEQLHLVYGPLSPHRQCLVLAVDRQVMAHYLTLAESLSAPLKGIYPDYLGLTEGEASRGGTLDERILIRHPDGSGMVVATGTGPLPWLPPCPPTSGKALASEWLSAPTYLNLLQGEYDNRASDSGSSRRFAMLAVAASVALLTAYFLAAGWYFKQLSGENTAQATALYQSLFPEDKRIVNIRRQMAGHLERVQNAPGKDTFLPLLSGLSQAIAQVPEADISPRHLQFDRTGGALIAELQGGSVASTSQLRQALDDNQLAADILSVTKNDAGVLTRLEIKLP